MPARDQEHQVREVQPVGEARGERMRLEVIDCDQRLAERGGQRLAGGQPHQHAPDQPRTGGGGDGVDFAQLHAGLLGGAGDDAIEVRHMAAGGEFRHHPAIGGVLLELAAHHVGEDGATPAGIARDDRRGGLVAACLDPQNLHVCLPGAVERSKPSPTFWSGLQ